MKNKPQFKIGCSGFYNRHWKGIFYPEKLPQGRWLNFYCEHFNSLELNVTFYRFPTTQMLQGWYKKSPEDFLFSIKAPKLITHFKKFMDCNREIEDFYAACETGLKHKLGCVLFQLPPAIHHSEEKLKQVIESLKPGFRNVIEFRHKSWWKKSVYDELAKNDIIFCSISHPSLPETIVANNSIAYIRLHGNQKMFYSGYSVKELMQLYQAILKKRKIKEAFVYFNNTAGTAGVLNATELKNLANEKS